MRHISAQLTLYLLVPPTLSQLALYLLVPHISGHLTLYLLVAPISLQLTVYLPASAAHINTANFLPASTCPISAQLTVYLLYSATYNSTDNLSHISAPLTLYLQVPHIHCINTANPSLLVPPISAQLTASLPAGAAYISTVAWEEWAMGHITPPRY